MMKKFTWRVDYIGTYSFYFPPAFCYHHSMNGLEFRRGLYFGCDVFAAGNTRVESIRVEGETCEVTLPDGTGAILYSLGPRQGFYIQKPVKGFEGERYYFYASQGNPFLKLASGGIARAT